MPSASGEEARQTGVAAPCAGVFMPPVPPVTRTDLPAMRAASAMAGSFSPRGGRLLPATGAWGASRNNTLVLVPAAGCVIALGPAGSGPAGRGWGPPCGRVCHPAGRQRPRVLSPQDQTCVLMICGHLDGNDHEVVIS